MSHAEAPPGDGGDDTYTSVLPEVAAEKVASLII